MSLVPDITAGTGTESDEKPGWWCLWGCRSRKEHTRWPFPSMGLFSGCPAIWELADPRSTLLRQRGSIGRTAHASNGRGYGQVVVPCGNSAARPVGTFAYPPRPEWSPDQGTQSVLSHRSPAMAPGVTAEVEPAARWTRPRWIRSMSSGGKRQRASRHVGDVLRVPMRLHHAGRGVP